MSAILLILTLQLVLQMFFAFVHLVIFGTVPLVWTLSHYALSVFSYLLATVGAGKLIKRDISLLSDFIGFSIAYLILRMIFA